MRLVRARPRGLRARVGLALVGALGSASVFAFGAAQQAPPLPEGNAYVRSVLRDAEPQDAAINDYAYDVLETRERLNSEGKTRSTETRTYEVYFVKTRPVRRLVARNGVRLSPEEQRAEDLRAEAQAKAIAQGRTVNERPGIRLSSLVDRFEFRTIGREVRDSRPTLVFAFTPRKETPRSGEEAADRITRILRGRLFIDEEEKRVARLEASNAPGEDAKVATGVKLASLATVMDFARVAPRVWLPRTVMTEGTARVFFFRTVRVRNTTAYSNYRRFEVETEERPQPFF